MEKYDVVFKKKYGQNFLKNNYIVEKITHLCNFSSNSLVVEVGPGGAILTSKLAELCTYVVAYEIDLDLKEVLTSKLDNYSNVSIIFDDFLKVDLKKDLNRFDYDHLFFISNVPYYITTPILIKLINSGLVFDKIIMMVQKEVGERFSSVPGVKSYGAITVLLSYYFDVKKEFKVSRKEFIPEPNVDSMVISFTSKNNKYKLNDYNHFEKLVFDSFQFKRKTLRNNLKSYDLEIINKVLKNYGFDDSVRAEKLSVDIFVDLSNSLCEREF